MINKGESLEGLAMPSCAAATGTPTTMPACSISTTTGPTTRTTTSAFADPRQSGPDDGNAVGGAPLLGRDSPAAPAAKARLQAHPETAPGAAAAGAGFGSNFLSLTSLSNLHECWLKARRNKGGRYRIQRFAEDVLGNLARIQAALRAGTYRFGPYQVFTVIEKKRREVVDAPMPDRIVHWMVYRYLLPIWLPRFIHDTFGNLPDRGTHAAVRRLASFAGKQGATWALQLDISKYFYAVPHAQLKTRALRYIGDERLRRLITQLIDSFQTGNQYDELFAPDSPYRTTAAKGMPIGNLSSQLFANIYLSDFDHWAKETLRLRWYIRYVDDIAILGSSREELQAIATQIIARLHAEGLAINPRKIRIAPVKAGLPFLGYVIWPTHTSAGRYLRRRYHYRLRQHEKQGQDRTEAINAYRAALAHTGSNRQRRAA